MYDEIRERKSKTQHLPPFLERERSRVWRTEAALLVSCAGIAVNKAVIQHNFYVDVSLWNSFRHCAVR